jgi:uncharacterized protein YndB with AHSA1/START domain
MKKTGEAYTAARLQLARIPPAPDYASVAGMTDSAVSARTGRTWAEWVRLLDAAHAAEQPHRQIAAHVASLGTPSWWTQMVTVGSERIRGLRAKGQRRGGGYEAGKSRTFDVPVEALYRAFASARKRRLWLAANITVRSATPHKRMRLALDDGTLAMVDFTSKGKARSSVSVRQDRLPDKAAAEAVKASWTERFGRLRELLA